MAVRVVCKPCICLRHWVMEALEPHRQKQLPNVKLFSNLSVFAVTDPYVVLQGYESVDVEATDAKVDFELM